MEVEGQNLGHLKTPTLDAKEQIAADCAVRYSGVTRLRRLRSSGLSDFSVVLDIVDVSISCAKQILRQGRHRAGLRT